MKHTIFSLAFYLFVFSPFNLLMAQDNALLVNYSFNNNGDDSGTYNATLKGSASFLTVPDCALPSTLPYGTYHRNYTLFIYTHALARTRAIRRFTDATQHSKNWSIYNPRQRSVLHRTEERAPSDGRACSIGRRSVPRFWSEAYCVI